MSYSEKIICPHCRKEIALKVVAFPTPIHLSIEVVSPLKPKKKD